MNKLPQNVQNDVDNEFIMTDVDYGFQRCRIISDTVFEYRCEASGQEISEIIDIDDIDQEEAVSGYYGSVEEVRKEYGKSANMIIAECVFEHGLK